MSETRCQRCHRPLRDAKSIARRLGPTCRAIRRRQAIAGVSAAQADQIEQAFVDGAIVPAARAGVFRVVGSDGDAIYITSPRGCNCPDGLRTRPRGCWHRAAAGLALAA